MNFMLETASNREAPCRNQSWSFAKKKCILRNKITAFFYSTYGANIIFVSEDKQVHSSNIINNKSSL